MVEQESLRQVAQSRAPFSAWLGTVILFLLFGVIVLVLIGPAPRADSYEQTKAKKRTENLKTLRDEDAKSLTTYGWVDQKKGVARIPIEVAMKLTAAELAQKKPTAAGPIATPAPSAAPPASPSPSALAAKPKTSATPPATSVEGPQSENRGQPAAASNPPPAVPGTQPGPSATPAASPGAWAKPENSTPPVPAATPGASAAK